MTDRAPPHALIDLDDETATVKLAERLSEMCSAGNMIALHGDLGMGKTVFARAFIRYQTTPDEEVPSPTFTLVQIYDTATDPIYHFDLYRLNHPDEVLELGFDDALSDGTVLVEWPDRLGPYLPRDRLDIELLQGSTGNARRAALTGHGYWQARMTDAFMDGKIHA